MIQEAPYTEVLAIRHEVMYPHKHLEYVTLSADDKGLHIGYYENDHLASVVSLFLDGRILQFRKLATKKEYQNKGYASNIIKWILDYAKDVKLEKVWCNSRNEKIPFYEKFGFVKTGNTFERNGYNYTVIEIKIQNA